MGEFADAASSMLPRYGSLLILRRLVLGLVLFLAFRDLLLVLLIGQLVPAHPREAHVVYRPLSERHQVIGIRIEPVGRGVVVIPDRMQDRPGREQRLQV